MNMPSPAATNGQVQANNKSGTVVMVGLIRLATILVQSLTDTYRPERHYMRGPARSGGPSTARPRPFRGINPLDWAPAIGGPP